MPAIRENLRKLAELNFCKDCYPKYLDLIDGTIDYLLAEPMSDWRETEQNINLIWIKAKGLNTVQSGVFSVRQNAFEEAYSHRNPISRKLKFLRKEGLIKEYTYEFLDKVRDRRNRVHPPKKFSNKDYILFREAKKITDLLRLPIIHESCSDIWKNDAYIETYAKQLLEKPKLWLS